MATLFTQDSGSLESRVKTHTVIGTISAELSHNNLAYLATLSTQDMGSEASRSSTSSERPEAAAMALAIVQPRL